MPFPILSPPPDIIPIHGQTPAELGFHSRYTAFRPIQDDITDMINNGPGGEFGERADPKPVIAGEANTGSGKSVAAQRAAINAFHSLGVRTVILTATNALKDIYTGLETPGFAQIQGRRNYECTDRDPKNPLQVMSCENGYDELDCKNATKKDFCPYAADWHEASEAQYGFVTTYSMWMSVRGKNRNALESKLSPNRIGMLICDEAHLAPQIVAKHLSCSLSTEEIRKWTGGSVQKLLKLSNGVNWAKVDPDWLQTLSEAHVEVSMKQISVASQYESEAMARRLSKEYRRLERLAENLGRVVEHGEDGNWLWRLTQHGIAFDCVWPGRYMDRYLWCGVPKIVLLSATLRPKLLNIYGLREQDYYYREWPRQFPSANSPVLWVPTGSMKHGESQDELGKSVVRLDEIIEEWGLPSKHGGRYETAFKGIVHTNSYKRAEWLQSKSKYGRFFVLNQPNRGLGGTDSSSASETYERFLKMEPPAILVSPSFTTGADFKDADARWQVINKMPFPDRSDPIMQARMEMDKGYYAYETAQTFQQTCGRLQRHEKDWGITVVTDDSVNKFLIYAKPYLSSWFRVQKIDSIPRRSRWERHI